MVKLPTADSRALDLVCIGRSGVDICAEQYGVSFAEVQSFTKQIGGSSANIAVGAARLGQRVGFISCVSADPVGEYVRDFLANEGIDVRHVGSDDTGTRTSLSVAEIKPADCVVLIYRNNAADLALAPDDIDERYIASARMLLLTGTALSTNPSREASFQAIEYARRNGTAVALDLDYRPYSWQSAEETARVLGEAAAKADILIGNREEFNVLEGSAFDDAGDDDATAERFQNDTCSVLIVKHGGNGSKTYARDEAPFASGIFKVEAIKPFGAGDGFASAFCSGLLDGRSLRECVARGSASAAIVVSKIGCAEAMPTADALDEFMSAFEGGSPTRKNYA